MPDKKGLSKITEDTSLEIEEKTSFWIEWIDRNLRRFLPRSLLGRSLLIILLPLLVTQAISLELFYGTFLNIVSRRLTDMISGEICYTVDQFVHAHSEKERLYIIQQSQTHFQLEINQQPMVFPVQKMKRQYVIGPVDELLDRSLKERLPYPFYIDWKENADVVKISVQLDDETLNILTSRKRLGVGSLWLFVLWVVGSALILFMIAAIFVWIQVQAIRRLSKAAELFGKGRDPGFLHPIGAKEIRNAASAFNLMRDRIQRFVQQRTVILASVSHDLRTPLTRLRLSLAMLPRKGKIDAERLDTDISDMISDTEEMEYMINGYLSFARGEGTEEPYLTDMVQLIEDSVASARRAGTEFRSVNISNSFPDLIVRAGSIRRVLGNILENARQYGGSVSLKAMEQSQGVFIIVKDNGTGIPPELLETVFKPFETGNTKKGTGLGLAIARDIIQAHGGKITLKNDPEGGLCVTIYLPY